MSMTVTLTESLSLGL